MGAATGHEALPSMTTTTRSSARGTVESTFPGVVVGPPTDAEARLRALLLGEALHLVDASSDDFTVPVHGRPVVGHVGVVAAVPKEALGDECKGPLQAELQKKVPVLAGAKALVEEAGPFGGIPADERPLKEDAIADYEAGEIGIPFERAIHESPVSHALASDEVLVQRVADNRAAARIDVDATCVRGRRVAPGVQSRGEDGQEARRPFVVRVQEGDEPASG
jgi:hypothetical protein